MAYESPASRTAGNCSARTHHAGHSFIGAQSNGKTQEISLAASMPAGWTVQSGIGKFTVAAKQVAAARIEVLLPAVPENETKKPEPQEISVHANSNGQTIGR